LLARVTANVTAYPGGVSSGYPQFTPPRPGPVAGPGMPEYRDPASLTDAQLRQLPPPSPPAAHGDAGAGQYHRPAAITIAATLAVTGSLQWICGLTFLWLAAIAGADTLSRSGAESAVFHILHRFDVRMTDGLALPLFLFPAAAFLSGFLILWQRPWTRISHTALGVAALAWSAWWLQNHLLWWCVAGLYILVGCLLLWTPGASHWYGRHGSEGTGQPLS
jgi:hypothetical protein